jgi:hypothetical protein
MGEGGYKNQKQRIISQTETRKNRISMDELLS